MPNIGGGTFSVTEVMVVQIGKAGDILEHLLKLLAVIKRGYLYSCDWTTLELKLTRSDWDTYHLAVFFFFFF